MPTADSLSFEILKTGENQVKILVIKKQNIISPHFITFRTCLVTWIKHSRLQLVDEVLEK